MEKANQMNQFNEKTDELMWAVMESTDPGEKFYIHTRLETFTFTTYEIAFGKDHNFNFVTTDEGHTATLNGDPIIGWSRVNNLSPAGQQLFDDVYTEARLQQHHRRLKRVELIGWYAIALSVGFVGSIIWWLS